MGTAITGEFGFAIDRKTPTEMTHKPIRELATTKRLRSLFLRGLAVLCPITAGAQFNPPRITDVIHLLDRGSDPSGSQKLYSIDKGNEANITTGDTLNVYREKRVSSLARQPLRILVGTLAITEALKGSSLGTFIPNEVTGNSHAIRHKSAMKGDFVIPRLTLDSNVLFDPGKADLKGVAAAEFAKVANFIKYHSPSLLIVEGHTDSDGDDAYNKQLSQLRAEAVRNLLVDGNDFISGDMIVAKGYGEERPRAPNDSAVNKALNRRIEVLVSWESLEERVDPVEMGAEETEKLQKELDE